MTAFKYWDEVTSTWKVLGSVQGPVGPAGPAGGPGPATLETFIGPNAPAPRGDYTVWVDTDEPDPTAVGILNTQRLLGQGASYKAAAGGLVYADAAGTVPMRLYYTPPVNCWWEVHAEMGTIQKLDAAYHYGYLDVVLSPADADGFAYVENLEVQYNGVQTYAFRAPTGLFKLVAGQAYTVQMNFNIQGGSWQYANGPANLSMFAKAWAR